MASYNIKLPCIIKSKKVYTDCDWKYSDVVYDPEGYIKFIHSVSDMTNCSTNLSQSSVDFDIISDFDCNNIKLIIEKSYNAPDIPILMRVRNRKSEDLIYPPYYPYYYYVPVTVYFHETCVGAKDIHTNEINIPKRLFTMDKDKIVIPISIETEAYYYSYYYYTLPENAVSSLNIYSIRVEVT